MDYIVKTTIWKVGEAKSRLSEVLNQARRNGPQIIGARNPCVVVSQEEWNALSAPEIPLGQFLVEESPKVELELPVRGGSSRAGVRFSEK